MQLVTIRGETMPNDGVRLSNTHSVTRQWHALLNTVGAWQRNGRIWAVDGFLHYLIAYVDAVVAD